MDLEIVKCLGIRIDLSRLLVILLCHDIAFAVGLSSTLLISTVSLFILDFSLDDRLSDRSVSLLLATTTGLATALLGRSFGSLVIFVLDSRSSSFLGRRARGRSGRVVVVIGAGSLALAFASGLGMRGWGVGRGSSDVVGPEFFGGGLDLGDAVSESFDCAFWWGKC